MASSTSERLRGVNFGGWLLLEKWMTPTLFAGTNAEDEHSFVQTDGAKEKIEHHRQTFIQEEDFVWLANHGINAIRLPIGYWILEPDGPYVEGISYVDWAFTMADTYNFKILLDLHGVPGSQNGKDHSGQIGRAAWLTDERKQDATLAILERLHERYKSYASYWGIQILNEPSFGLIQRSVRRFYRRAVSRIHGGSRIVFHDGFTPRLMSGVLRDDRRAVMDIHLYHMASFWGKFVSARQFVKHAPRLYGRLIRWVSRKQPVIIGEWSSVLDGRKTKNIPREDAERLMLSFARAQMAVFEQDAIGWFYWNYKTEGRGVWNFRSLVEDDLLQVTHK